MPADSINGPKPPASEVVKSAVKKPDIKSETQGFKETLHTLREKVTSIFSSRKNNPVDTFQQLASQEIPGDQSVETQKSGENFIETDDDTISILDPNAGEKIKAYEAAQKLSQQIKDEARKSSENQPIAKTLFPDQPSLYEQHHQKYDQERKTAKGKITRVKDIIELKKFGVQDATYTYDGLRSRGVNREKIIGLSDNGKARISQLTSSYSEEKYTSTRKYKKTDLPKAVDRLYSINRFDPKSFDTDENFTYLHGQSFTINHLTDEQFNQRKSELQPYIFLKGMTVEDLFYQSNLQIKPFLDYVQQTYFSNHDNNSTFNDKVVFDSYSTAISPINILRQIVKQDIHTGEKISIPNSVIAPLTPNDNISILYCLNNIQNRDLQKYFLLHSYILDECFDKETFLAKPEFFDSVIKHFSSGHYEETIPQKIDIPQDVVDGIQKPYLKDFYHNLSGLSTFELQEYYLHIKDEGKYDLRQFFNEGKPNFLFYREFILNKVNNSKPQSSVFSDEQLSHLPQNVKIALVACLNTTSQDKNLDTELKKVVLNNVERIDLYFNEQGQPNSLFLKQIFSNYGFQGPIVDYIKDNLTQENLSTFTPEDQRLWNCYLNIKGNYGPIINQIIFTNRNNLDLYFNQQNLPNSTFFENFYQHLDSLNSTLSLEIIDTFPNKEDQKLWKRILKIKKPTKPVFELILQNKTKIDSFFNTNNQPTSLLLEKSNDLEFINNCLTPELIDTFPNKVDQKLWRLLYEKNISLEDKKKIISNNTCKLIIGNREQLIKDSSDIDFLNILIGMFGKKNESVIGGYLESLSIGAITREDKPLVLELLKEFSALSPNIIKGYKEAKQNHTEKLFILNLKESSRKLISSKSLDSAEVQSFYYQDLVKHVYSNNSAGWANYESNNSCSDRTRDLSEFDIKDVYQIDLLSQGDIKIKAGEEIDLDIQSRLEKPVLQVLENLQSINFDQETGNQLLHQQTDRLLSQINLPNIDLSKLSIEDKLFIVASESIYHHQEINPDDIKNLLITYEFVNFEDIRNFIQGTNDKVSQASNQTYAHLCELNNFYSDRIKEVNKKIIESASTNSEVNKLFLSYFQNLSEQNFQRSNQDNINKLQVDKLGLSNGFIDQITKTLQRRFPNKKYTSDQIRRMLHVYETVTQGLTEPKSASPDKNTQAFYGQLRSQREKTFTLSEQLGNDYIDPQSIHLDEINLQQAINLNQSTESGNFNQEEFLAFTAQKFVDIFSNERTQLDTELSKYISENGGKRETLNAYITKTKSSAHARMVGGVCVSGDNPAKNKEKNIWDMPNYFQMVFQDPQTYQCLGLCLLHHFEENGKKILTVSFNPSSTYLYSVDESSFFSGILDQIQEFAKKNNFDIITTSKNHAIRTNRTGGLFEQTIDKKVSQVEKTFSFSEEKQFSFSPNYVMKDMDIIWENQK